MSADRGSSVARNGPVTLARRPIVSNIGIALTAGVTSIFGVAVGAIGGALFGLAAPVVLLCSSPELILFSVFAILTPGINILVGGAWAVGIAGCAGCGAFVGAEYAFNYMDGKRAVTELCGGRVPDPRFTGPSTLENPVRRFFSILYDSFQTITGGSEHAAPPAGAVDALPPAAPNPRAVAAADHALPAAPPAATHARGRPASPESMGTELPPLTNFTTSAPKAARVAFPTPPAGHTAAVLAGGGGGSAFSPAAGRRSVLSSLSTAQGLTNRGEGVTITRNPLQAARATDAGGSDMAANRRPGRSASL